MKMTITAKKMQIPQNFTEYAEKRLNSKLNKFFGEEADAKITMATHKNLIVIELTVDYNNMKYRAEQSAVDKEDALDAAIDKIIRQIRRNKTRVEKKLKDSAFKDVAYEDVVPESDYPAQEVRYASDGCRRGNLADELAGTYVLHVPECKHR